VLLNGKVSKPGAQVKPGDIIEIVFGNSRMKVEVVSTPEHVGKDDAGSLYKIIND